MNEIILSVAYDHHDNILNSQVILCEDTPHHIRGTGDTAVFEAAISNRTRDFNHTHHTPISSKREQKEENGSVRVEVGGRRCAGSGCSWVGKTMEEEQ